MIREKIHKRCVANKLGNTLTFKPALRFILANSIRSPSSDMVSIAKLHKLTTSNRLASSSSESSLLIKILPIFPLNESDTNVVWSLSFHKKID